MLFTIIKKEIKQLSADKGFLMIALIQPIILIIMFGSSFQQGDINHLATSVIDQDNSTFSNYVVNAIENSEFFDIGESSQNIDKEKERLDNSEIRALIVIPPDFGENISKSETGNINFYLDSSNFLTYSSLSSAKADVAKRALQNITKDILEELEYEKEKSEKVIEEIRALFDKVQKEADSIQNQIKDMKIDLNFSDIEESISCLKSSVKRQKNSLDEIKNNLNQMSSLVSTIGTSGETEEIKKQTVIAGLTEIIDGINESKQDIEESLDGINKIDVSGVLNKNYTKEINKKVDNIEKIFVEAESKAGDIEINLGKLKSKFLSEPISLETTATNGEIRYFDYLGAGVLSLIVFFICIMTPALNIVSEKEKNTLYRLSTTPASSVQIFIGKFFTFLVFGFIEMIYTLFLAIIIYDLRITGNIYHVIVVLTLLACASISVGLFISSKVKTMQQTLILIPLIIIPSFLISHAFFPPDIMADFMNKVAYATPMTFSNHALNAIMIKGHSLNQLTLDLSILAIFTLVPLVFFIRSYKRMKY